jgi:RNA polymerase sigma-70 factor (ECF subfamily)
LSGLDDARAAVARAHLDHWAVVLAATMSVTNDIHLAEECVQEAYTAALTSWNRDGVPANPAAWLTTVSRRRARDAQRRSSSSQSTLRRWSMAGGPDGEDSPSHEDNGEESSLADERLRLVFMCCHPALSREAQVALTLRLVCGLSTPDIARGLLVSDTTMSARLTRAKKKIVTARIPFRVPRDFELPDRLRGVLAVVYLLFTMGHTAPSGDRLMRPELSAEAIRLTRMLRELMPDEPEVRGLLALMLATDARRSSRTGLDGELVRLAEQNRSQWARESIAEAQDLVAADVLSARPLGPYAIQALIALAHAEAPSYDETPWLQILELYDRLLMQCPSPVVALNRAVALSQVAGAEAALEEVEKLEGGGELGRYHYLHAVKGDLLRSLGRTEAASRAEQLATELAGNEAERQVLARRAEG